SGVATGTVDWRELRFVRHSPGVHVAGLAAQSAMDAPQQRALIYVQRFSGIALEFLFTVAGKALLGAGSSSRGKPHQ
ncbi:MAG TPA: hypothetical protein VIH17_08810, partial [Candidatus Acidoferrales bacterium]